jgi:hypothetical protein
MNSYPHGPLGPMTGTANGFYRYAVANTADAANWHIQTPATFVAEGEDMADATRLYDVLIIDSRVENDDGAVCRSYVRSDDADDARLRAILRHGYAEHEIKYLDVMVNLAAATVKDVVAADYDDEDEE